MGPISCDRIFCDSILVTVFLVAEFLFAKFLVKANILTYSGTVQNLSPFLKARNPLPYIFVGLTGAAGLGSQRCSRSVSDLGAVR